MGVDGCLTCVKYLMFAFNFLFWLCGCALLGLGLYLCFEPSMREYAVTSGDLEEYYIALYVLIGVGGLMMLVGFLGCCGACAENRVLLGLFFIFLLIICVIEIGGGFYMYFNQEKLQQIVKDGMYDAVTKAYGDDEVITAAIDGMHQSLECCGATGIENFVVNVNIVGIPKSCCKVENCEPPPIITVLKGETIIYTQGCADVLFEQLESKTIIIAGLSIGIGVVQLLGMIFSCCLCCAIGRQDRSKDYI